MVIVDGAHNAYSMRKLVESIKNCFTCNRCFVIIGTSCDKDIPGMARELRPLTDNIIVTSSSHPRAASISILVEEFAKQGIKVDVIENTSTALSKPLFISHSIIIMLTAKISGEL